MSASEITQPLPRRGTRHRFALLRSVMALILREMSTRYGRTPGGYVWAVIEPLGAIIVLSVGFSLVLRAPSLGNSFLLFYASGYLILSLFQNVSNLVARSLLFSKALLVYPRVTWLDAILARFLLNTLTNVLIAYLLLTVVIAMIDTRIILNIAPMALAMAMSALLALAFGTLNCALFGLFPAWEAIWGIATRPLFLASGIFYIYEDLPTLAQEILWWNPLLHLSGMMRTGLYPSYRPDYLNPLLVLVVSVVVLALGLLLMRRHHKDILNR